MAPPSRGPGAPGGSGSSRPTASLRLSRARFLINPILGIPRNSLLTENYRKNGTLLFLKLILFSLTLRCVLLVVFPVPYGNDGFGRIFFSDQLFLSHWLPLTQLIVQLGARLSDGILPIRLLFAVCGSLAAFGFYLYLRLFLDRGLAFLGGLLFSVNPLYLMLALMPYQDVLFLGLFYASLAVLLGDAPPCVPGMRAVWEGASPSANLMEVKAREAQGRHREVGSEGSVEQTYEPTNGNWISRRQGRTSQRVVTKSISIKDRKRKSSGCVRKGSVLTPGGLGGCPLKDRKVS